MEENQPSNQAIQLRIQLRGISPPIWRRVIVSDTLSIRDFHTVIQKAMGWENEHLYCFTIRGYHYGIQPGIVHFFSGSTQLCLSEFQFAEHERFVYEYDFYSEWYHDIRVEKMLSIEKYPELPVCLDGRGACPPEDSGPADRFMSLQDRRSIYDFMDWLEEEMEEEHFSDEELRDRIWEWLPWLEPFDLSKVNVRLKQNDPEFDNKVDELEYGGWYAF